MKQTAINYECQKTQPRTSLVDHWRWLLDNDNLLSDYTGKVGPRSSVVRVPGTKGAWYKVWVSRTKHTPKLCTSKVTVCMLLVDFGANVRLLGTPL